MTHLTESCETEKRNRGATIIGQLINDIQENDWYCIHSGIEDNLHEWEKALLVAGLESLLGWQGWKFEGGDGE